jgi:hypothetical protein
MGKKYKYVSLDRIFSKVLRDFDYRGNEGDVVEWCGEALEFVGAPSYYEEAVAFIEVKNHQGELPVWLHSITQIARDNQWVKVPERCVTPKAVVETLDKPYCKKSMVWSEEDSEYVLLDCDGNFIYDYEVAYYRPYFDLKYLHDLWRNTSLYKGRFTPVRPSTNTFGHSLLAIDGQDCNSCKDEYTIIQNSILRFSFKEGMVAVAYTRQVVDKVTGYPLVPDNISYTTAISYYIMMKAAQRDFEKGRAGAEARLTRYERDWQWYCQQAGNADMMLHGVDEHQDFLDQRQRLLPQNNQYSSFFGNLSNPEVRVWNDPNGNNHSRFIARNR